MIHVTSEVGRLRRVLVDEPGMEVDHMVPSSMDELLFDDLLFGDRAREEHALFRRVLRLLDVETVEALDLLAETLEDPEAREWILGLLPAELSLPLRDRLDAASARELAIMLTAGCEAKPLPESRTKSCSRSPPANWCFQRDPQILLAGGVIFGAMASPARHREGLVARAIFRFHPDMRNVPVVHDPLERALGHPLLAEEPRPCLEGGTSWRFRKTCSRWVIRSERIDRLSRASPASSRAGTEGRDGSS